MMKKVLVAILMFLVPLGVFANKVTYDFKVTSMEENVGKVTLKWEEESTENIQVTGYTEVDDNTIEVGFKTGTENDLREVTIFSENVIFPPLIILKNKGEEVLKYKDVPEDKEVKESIKRLSQKQIINGYPDGTFKPDKKVSRQEFTVMLVRAAQFKLEEEIPSKFTDVKNDAWSKNHIMTLANKGIINGKGNGKFAPTADIKLAEVLTILNKTFKIQKKQKSGYKEQEHWGNESIKAMYKADILKETDELYENLNPEKLLTRAECALLINRVFDTLYEVR